MDRIESIKLALNNEASEMKWYLEQAERSSDPVLKELFKTLAGDEKEHMTRIKTLHEKLTSEGQWPDDVPIQVAGTNIKQVLEKVRSSGLVTPSNDESDLDALKRASEFEDKGSKFYAELAEKCANPMEKKFFEFLSQIEREHMLSIKDSMFYLEDPEGWLEHKGRSGLDGA